MADKREVYLTREKKRDPAREERMLKILRLLVILLALRLLWGFLGVEVYSLFLRTEVAERVYFDHYITSQGLLAFREKVVTADQGGKLEWLKEEGRRVAVGEEVARMILPLGGEVPVTSPAAGIFTSYIDGLEDLAYPHQGWVPQSEVFSRLKPLPQGFSPGDEVPGGSALFKIVDNYTWYYTLILSGDELGLLTDSRRLSIGFDFSPGIYPVDRLDYHALGEGQFFAVLSLSRDVEDFYRRRWEEARVIYRREEAVSLPASALMEREEGAGVYRLVRNRLVFLEVEVVGNLPEEGRLAVLGLDPGFEIVTNPRFFREGQRF